MKEENENFRYRPAAGPLRKPDVEEERERYYELVRLKLSTGRLHRISVVNLAAVLGAIAFFFLGSLLLPKPETSAVEKRDLARMPKFSVESLFRGKLTRDIETFYADTFPMRDQFVSLSAVLNEQRGIRVDNVRIVAPSGGETQDIPPQPQVDAAAPAASVPQKQEPAASSSEESSAAPEPSPTENEMVGPVSNGMFVYKGMAMSLFGGSDQMARWYADVVNTYQRELPDVQVYDMIIPTAIEFYVPDKYRDLTSSQKRTMDIIYHALDSNVKKVDAYSELQQHTDEYLYFRTDHHWTARGAYYAYQAFCQQAGFTPIRPEDCETRRLDNFIGTMYAQTQDSTLLQNPDYVEYFIFPQSYQALLYARNSPYYGVPCSLWAEYAKSPNSYSVFLAGDYPLIQVKTNIHNGRKIMIVKESFGNAFAPYLINHYEEVYIVDQRYFQLASVEFIKEHGINELIFANNSFAVCTPYHIRCIDNMRHQPYVPYVPPETASSQEEEASSSEENASDSDEKQTDQKESEKKQKELAGELHRLIKAKNSQKDS